jgi:hypothetical protein
MAVEALATMTSTVSTPSVWKEISEESPIRLDQSSVKPRMPFVGTLSPSGARVRPN